MKKKIARIIVILFTIVAFSGLPTPAKAEGWKLELTLCYDFVTGLWLPMWVCDEWGGSCAEPGCCEDY